MPSSKRPLSHSERLDWLRLIRTDNVGPITFRALLQRYGSASAALEALPDLARRGGRRRPLKPMPRAAAERELELCARLGARVVGLVEPDYPEALAMVEDAPPLIVVRGNAHLLRRRAVAVVGARNASANGRLLAERLARDLGQAELNIVSGLARGIDSAAHAGALAAGTTAVMAGGVDVVYPPENRPLYDQIVAQGAALSEGAPGLTPTARHFPKRNRLIAGLSLAVVVVEAAPRSGSLITARLAAEQGREVLAVPGSPLDPRAQGCNLLIRRGATLVQSADDVLEALAALLRRPFAEPAGAGAPSAGLAPDTPEGLDEARTRLLECLSPAPTPVDELVRASQLSAPLVLTVLLELELAGRLERQPGQRVCLVDGADDATVEAG